jgi:hypothetical protein
VYQRNAVDKSLKGRTRVHPQCGQGSTLSLCWSGEFSSLLGSFKVCNTPTRSPQIRCGMSQAERDVSLLLPMLSCSFHDWYHHLLNYKKLCFATSCFTVDSQVRRSTKVIVRSPRVERPRQGRHPRRRQRPPRPQGLAALGRLLVAMRSGLALQLELRVGLQMLVSRVAVTKLQQIMLQGSMHGALVNF